MCVCALFVLSKSKSLEPTYTLTFLRMQGCDEKNALNKPLLRFALHRKKDCYLRHSNDLKQINMRNLNRNSNHVFVSCSFQTCARVGVSERRIQILPECHKMETKRIKLNLPIGNPKKGEKNDKISICIHKLYLRNPNFFYNIWVSRQ